MPRTSGAGPGSVRAMRAVSRPERGPCPSSNFRRDGELAVPSVRMDVHQPTPPRCPQDVEQPCPGHQGLRCGGWPEVDAFARARVLSFAVLRDLAQQRRARKSRRASSLPWLVHGQGARTLEAGHRPRWPRLRRSDIHQADETVRPADGGAFVDHSPSTQHPARPCLTPEQGPVMTTRWRRRSGLTRDRLGRTRQCGWQGICGFAHRCGPISRVRSDILVGRFREVSAVLHRQGCRGSGESA
ncbi:hypothetical protein C8E05_5099 [Rhodococcus wratislaviensis]|uniref:Uncharacterized protein n=1 Tax=Rhodococcus wratislaviensis TaxID=44752 RepID=A0AB38FDE9_RHOWR|nr:hypothetical protein C8E05_5099 [Rhodococcus wratislaviensis]SPZ39332.1 Uncharacterised protein [Rhodococcus wratislaviensis]